MLMNKYGLQMKNILACQLNTSWVLVFCIYTHVCSISKDICINKEK